MSSSIPVLPSGWVGSIITVRAAVRRVRWTEVRAWGFAEPAAAAVEVYHLLQGRFGKQANLG